jgi:hypothetical protein
MRITIIATALAVAIIALVVINRRPNDGIAKPESTETLPPMKEVKVPREWPAATPPESTQAPAPALQIASVSDRDKQIDLRQLEASPAKDTPEAKQIEALLTAHGFDRAALPAAYGYAYEFHRLGGMIDGADEGARLHLQNSLRPQRSRLGKYGELNEAFLTNLLAIHPTVFFGQRNIHAPMPVPQ